MEMKQMIECVPNFSEGRDREVIRQIAEAIGRVDGVKVLNVDQGEAANRTVITFVGTSEAVAEAAFQGAKTAQQTIDMSHHHGEHPRIGATDVLPFVPIKGISLEECAALSRRVGRRMAEELGIPVYLYEAAALRERFRNLAVCRIGEYEGLAQRLVSAEDAPDLGARPMDKVIRRSGCSVVGARDFLLAVNFNLDTTSVSVARDIARAIRERGYQGKAGALKCVKAIGWFIREYGIAQVSCNLTNYHVTSLQQAYDATCREAERRGVRVTGTEIIGLVPEDALPEDAVRTLGLDSLRPFDETKILRIDERN